MKKYKVKVYTSEVEFWEVEAENEEEAMQNHWEGVQLGFTQPKGCSVEIVEKIK